MIDDIGYDATPGPVTRLDAVGTDVLADVASDPTAVAAVGRGLVLHPFLAALYDVEIPEDHLDDVQIRGAAGMVERLLRAELLRGLAPLPGR